MNAKWSFWLKLVGLMICMAYVVISIRALDLRAMTVAITEADPIWLTASVLALLGRFLIWSWKWVLMVRRQDFISLSLGNRLVLASAFINLVTPTAKIGGSIYRGMMLHSRFGWRQSTAYGWSFADQVSNLLGNILLFAVLALGAALVLPLAGWRGLLAGLGLVAGTLIACYPHIRRWLGQQLEKPRKARGTTGGLVDRLVTRLVGDKKQDRLEAFLTPTLRLGRTRQIFLVDIGLSSVSFWLLCSANICMFQALGVSAPFFAVGIVVMLAYLFGGMLGIFGGIGVTELFLIKLYGLIGVTEPLAAAAALLHRGSFYGLVLFWGGWQFWRLRKHV